MKFDISNFHTIFEAANDGKVISKVDIKPESSPIDIDDTTLDTDDVASIYKKACPISGEIFSAMKEAAADAKNLKITMSKDSFTENVKLYIEATEFATFCEASGMNIGEAAEEIIDTYKEEVPEMDNAEIHVVFPDDSLNKNDLGGDNLGRSVKDDWAMQMMRGCRRYGLIPNVGVDGIREAMIEKETKKVNLKDDVKKGLENSINNCKNVVKLDDMDDKK